MFEKFSISDIDSAGRGGEYTVQAGFGWTNGVALYIASLYGDTLVAPVCPNLTTVATIPSGSTSGSKVNTPSKILMSVFSVLTLYCFGSFVI